MSWFLLTIITISAVSAFPTDDTSVKRGHKIVGGQDAQIKNFPYQVSLEFNGTHNCGGTIVDKRHIVTAAHCFKDSAHLTVRVNSSVKEQGGKVIKVAQLHNHPEYSDKTFENDIAVIKLAEDLDFGVGIKPAELPPNKEHLSAGTYVNVTGWGYTFQDDYDGQLQAITVPIIDFKQCQDLYNHPEDPSPVRFKKGMICAGLLEGGQNACSGDSGGPLVMNGILYAVVSWGNLFCFEPKSPGVYTDVIEFINFVKDKIAL